MNRFLDVFFGLFLAACVAAVVAGIAIAIAESAPAVPPSRKCALEDHGE